MKSRFFLALAGLSLLACTPALAADNLASVMNNPAKTPFSYRTKDLGNGVHLPMHLPADETGAAIGPTNGLYVRQGGVWSFGLSGPIPAGTNAIGSVSISNLPATQAVSSASLGTPTDAAWDGATTSASQPSLLKAIWSKLSGLLSVDTVVRAAAVDRGAVLTTAGTAQTLVPANLARRGLAVQNRAAPGSAYSATTSVFMSCQATATQDFHSLEIPAGALYETPGHHTGTGACSFVSGTAATPVYIREF